MANTENKKTIDKDSKAFQYYDQLITKFKASELSKDDLIQMLLNKDSYIFNLKKIIYYLETYNSKFNIPCEKTVQENLTVLYSFKLPNQNLNVNIPLNYFSSHDLVRMFTANLNDEINKKISNKAKDVIKQVEEEEKEYLQKFSDFK